MGSTSWRLDVSDPISGANNDWSQPFRKVESTRYLKYSHHIPPFASLRVRVKGK